MSIASLADARIDRAQQTATSSPPTTQVARYIPTEAIGIYIAILALFNPLVPKPGQHLWQLNFTSRWVFLGLSLVGTGALVWLTYLAKARAAGHKGSGRDVPVFEIVIAMAAMAAWALALPDNPLQAFSWWQEGVSPVILTAATFLIPLVAAAIGEAPPIYEEPAIQ